MNTTQFQAFSRLVHDLTGVSIPEPKREMLLARLAKRMHALQIDSYAGYYKMVTGDACEKQAFVDTVTTHETRFFRTPRIWAYIEQDLLPHWQPSWPAQRFRAWSAATSSGEEAYSLSTLLDERRAQVPGFSYGVHGSDVSSAMIDRCLEAQYHERSVAQFRELMPERFATALRETADGYKPRAQVRAHVSFAQCNLFALSPEPDHFDLILLRNVLIYFSRDDQLRLLASIHRKLRVGGVLIIGESEFLSGLDHLFEHVQPLVYRAVHHAA